MRCVKYSIIVLFLFLFACESPNDPVVEGEPYMSLNIGDVRQYYSLQYGIWYQDVVSDTVRRVDGKLVYEIKSIIMTIPEEAWYSKGYEFIEDGFWWSCSKDTQDWPFYSELNPYQEMKILSTRPYEGQVFLEYENSPEEFIVYRKVELLDSLVLPMKTFYNVQRCTFTKQGVKFKVYSAEKYGFIRSETLQNNIWHDHYSRYLRVNGEEFGEPIEFPEYIDFDTINFKPPKEVNPLNGMRLY